MRRIIFLILFSGFFVSLKLSAQSGDSLQARITFLENKINILEKRLSTLEKIFGKDLSGKVLVDSNVIKLRAKAKARMKRDSENFSKRKIKKVEKLYKEASKNIALEQSKNIFKEIIKKYPGMNRAGCSALYLAQEEEGPEKSAMLNEVFEKYGDCMYGDGVEVGAYARYKLALIYREKDDVIKAKELMHYIRKNYPGAIDHDGNSLKMDLHD